MKNLTTKENIRKVIQLSAVIINRYLPDMKEAPNKNVDLRYVVGIRYKFHTPATGVSNRYYPVHHAYVGK
jgi:hypothetical protein